MSIFDNFESNLKYVKKLKKENKYKYDIPIRLLVDNTFIGEKILENIAADEYNEQTLYNIYRRYDISPLDFVGIVYENNPSKETFNIIKKFIIIINDLLLNYITTEEQLKERIKTWKNELSYEHQNDINKQKNNIDILKNFDVEKKFEISAAKTPSFQLSGSILKDNKLIEPEENYDFFNNLKMTEYIPYAQMYVNGKVWIKVNTNDKTLFKNEELDDNTIMLYILVDNKKSLLYSKMTINLKLSKFEYENQINSTEQWNIIQQHLLECLGENISFEMIKYKNISTSFNIYGLEYDDNSLITILNLDSDFSTFIFFKETGEPFGLKKNNIYAYHEGFKDIINQSGYYKTQSDLKFTMRQQYTTIKSDYETFNGGNIKLDVNTPFVHVDVYNAINFDTFIRFVSIMSVFMYYYQYYDTNNKKYLKNSNNSNTYRNSIRQPYIDIFGPIDNETIPVDNSYDTPKSKKSKKSEISKIDLLKSKAPQIFDDIYYPKKNFPFRQPIIINESEVEKYKNEQFEYKGEKLYRQVLKFPPHNVDIFMDKEQLYYTCVDNKAPFVGVQPTTESSHIYEEYPVRVSCFESNQLFSNNKTLTRLLYEDGVYENDKRKTHGRHIIKTDRIANDDSEAELNNLVETFLLNTVFDGKSTLRRIGTFVSNNSLLSSLLNIFDRKYKTVSENKRDDYTREIRSKISKNIYPGLLKQQMWDYDDETIIEMLEDNDIWLDPKLFIEAISEYFQVNIFIFWIPTQLRGNDNRKPYLMAPRYNKFLAYLPRFKKSVIIVQHLGSQTNNLENPQHELIVKIENRIYTPVFDEMVTLKLANIFRDTYNSYYIDSNLIMKNIGSNFNPLDYLNGYRAEYQIIDCYGKLRGLVSGSFQIFFPPSQPLNLPTTEAKLSSNIDADIIIEKYGLPRQIYNNGKYYGLIYGDVFIPVKKITNVNIKITREHPLICMGRNEIKNIIDTKNVAETIKKIFLYLYSLYPNSYNFNRVKRKENVKKFLDEYTIVDENIKYDFDVNDLPYKLEPSLSKSIKLLKTSVPILVENKKIVLMNDLLRNQIEFFLNYVRDKPISSFVRDKYMNISDFDLISNNLIFSNYKSYYNWNLLGENSSYKIHRMICDNLSKNINPYIYLWDKQLTMVQNTTTLESAITIGNLWLNEKINYGYGYRLDNIIANNYIKYIIDDNILIAVEDKSVDNKYVNILNYSGIWAALLFLV